MIENFCNYIRTNRGLSENTVKGYEESLRTFSRWAQRNYPGITWRTIEKTMIDNFVSAQVEYGIKPATIKRHISALRTFYKTILALGFEIKNPARYVSTPKLGEKLPKMVEPEAIGRALNDPLATPLAKACIAIIFETGVRLSELMSIKPCDINNKNRSIRIHGKGNKERYVYYGELTAEHGRALRTFGISDREIRRQIYEALRPHSKAPQLSPHAIRHTYASTLINNGMSIEAIRKLLGHEHTATTEIYAQMSNQRAYEQYRQYMPTLN